ncbi:N-6 DNA methylase [Panacibacter ginsenosidivorans]|uniref:site-specific DNA-methyltransferase (adenine-specific) n=1 Tax=Panacibacter ginsenosidivorans TaxID=1813871 RepID=A0A5B8VHF2_9BACT|nr:N-6 DNA methylase [Panacibacter ginsenosidivorans]QEC69738.1 N-6 DNA methylase [Panacibacter ginsenosidivorans]
MAYLAQYFTKDHFSNLLIQNIDFRGPKVIVDLGIGDGALTVAAIKKWRHAKYYGVDVDKERLDSLNERLPNVRLHNINSLDISLGKSIKIKMGTVDIAICNPPYLNLKKRSKYKTILRNAGLNNSVNIPCYTSDLIFLAQNINLLRDKGTLGIIVPEGIVCGHNFNLLRKDLLERHDLKMVIQLEPKIFNKTEAKTYILILDKGQTRTRTVQLCKADLNGKIEKRIKIQKTDLIERMDYKYHASANKNIKGKTLKELGVTIRRGNYSKNELEKAKQIYFHTTSNWSINGLSLRNTHYKLNKEPVIAKKGDILIGRVGRNCIDKITFVKSGKIAVTDCVYKVSISEEFREAVYNRLKSEEGKIYLQKVIHGVCAQVLSKKDLENFKVFVYKRHVHKK